MKPRPKETSRHGSSLPLQSDVPSWKRRLDIACIVLALPVLLPLAFLIAIKIKILSPGPVLFKQQRVGLRGRRFNCLKFRSMHVNADNSAHERHLSHLIRSNAPMVKMDLEGDRRLIPLGRLFRSTGLDELPQMLNVLRGEMSLVGPRPCLPYEEENYLPWHKERYATLPGLTGLWQVNGKNNTTFDEMMQLDVWYAKNKSLWLDVKILFKTIPAIIAQVRELRRKRRQASTRLCSPRTPPVRPVSL
jgi:lipopolysaccharide/colanic/teichoic acid biosynthesis glycosyltransferase